MFGRKMTQTSVEPAENKLFSSVDVNCTICELAVWHNCVNGRGSHSLDNGKQTNSSALHGATTGVIFIYSFFRLVQIFFIQLGRMRIWLFIGRFLPGTNTKNRVK